MFLQNPQILVQILGNTFVVRVNYVRIVSMCFHTKHKAFAGRQLTQNSTDTRGKPNIITWLHISILYDLNTIVYFAEI